MKKLLVIVASFLAGLFLTGCAFTHALLMPLPSSSTPYTDPDYAQHAVEAANAIGCTAAAGRNLPPMCAIGVYRGH